MADSIIKLFAEVVNRPSGHTDAPILYRAIAERIRARLLDESEAAVIAELFDRLAAGEDPRKVFVWKSRGGRPKGRTGPDDLEIALIVHQAIVIGGVKPSDAYKGVAKAHGMTPGNVRNIYGRLKGDLPKLHENQP